MDNEEKFVLASYRLGRAKMMIELVEKYMEENK